MIKFIIPIILILFIIVLIYLDLVKPRTTGDQLEHPPEAPSKRIVMIIVDSLMDQPLQSMIQQKNVPALQFLMNNGHYYPNMVSSYPTMSVVIDSTLLTGTYSDIHRVPGLVWFDDKEKRFVSYGSAKQEILKLGAKQVLVDSLFHLNHKHLSDKVKTIHEELNGQTASINTLVYRGNLTTKLNTPKLLTALQLLDNNASVKTPRYFSYGLLSVMNPTNKNTHLWQGFGFNDKFATQELKYLIEQKHLPAFSLVYLSDNDKLVHKTGSSETKGIEGADKQLQEILNSYDSWEEAIKDNVWIVMGDSGQTDVGSNKEESLIDLRVLLKDFQIHRINKPLQEKDQIVLGLNERMSFIYMLDDEINHEQVINILTEDNRIDLIAWKDGETVNVIASDYEGILSFKPKGKFTDQYGQTWTLEGNSQILDLEISNDYEIKYKDYPDGIARLYSSLYSHSGDYIVVNSKPGFEFIGEGSPTHVGGGSHGSLHKQDTLFPMIVVGTEQKPKHERMIDLREYILRILNNL